MQPFFSPAAFCSVTNAAGTSSLHLVLDLTQTVLQWDAVVHMKITDHDVIFLFRLTEGLEQMTSKSFINFFTH